MTNKKLVSGRDYWQSWDNALGKEPNGLDTPAKRKAWREKNKK